MRSNWSRWLNVLLGTGDRRRGHSTTRRRRVRLGVETLEERALPSTFTVTNLNGDGSAGSLGDELTQAVNAGGGTVDFEPGLKGIIQLTEYLPDLYGNIDIQGPGAGLLTVEGGNAMNNLQNVFTSVEPAAVIISGLTITGTGVAVQQNGGTLTIDNCAITGTTDPIESFQGSTTGCVLHVAHCNISNNADAGVDVPYATKPNQIDIVDSTISQNLQGGVSDENKGDRLTISDSTIAENQEYGGIVCGGTLDLTNSTVVNNSLTTIVTISGTNGAGLCNLGGSVVIADSIVAGNQYGTPGASQPSDVSGPVVSAGYNLIGSASPSGQGWAAADLLNANPDLGPLQDNGGPTPTCALLPGSPAIDAGDPAYPGGGTGDGTDQRGFNRVVNGRIDIGAYEYQPPATQVQLQSSAAVAAAGQPVTFTAFVQANLGANDRTGSVAFFVDNQEAAVETVQNNTAVFTDAGLAPGTNLVVAQYGGDTLFNESPPQTLVCAVVVPTTTSLSSSAPSAEIGQSVTFTATVGAEADVQNIPTGSVTFLVDGSPVTTAPVSNGVATFATSFQSTGTHAVVADYNGAPDFSSSSASLNEALRFDPVVTIIGGAGQNTLISTAFPTLFQVKVTDTSGDPVPGVGITFEAPAQGPSGAFAGDAATVTDAMGIATAPVFVANRSPGTYQVLVAVHNPPAAGSPPGSSGLTSSDGGITVGSSGSAGSAGANAVPSSVPALTLTNTAIPAGIHVVSGDHQQAIVDASFGTPLQVKVTDAQGKPVSGIGVSFTSPDNGPSASFASARTVVTNAAGLATAPVLTANTVAGSFTVDAWVAGLTKPAQFTLANRAGAPATIAAAAGTSQTAVVAHAYHALSVQVRDAFGNLVPGAPVTFTAPATGAGGRFAGKSTVTVLTGHNGIATAPTFTANHQAGSFVVTATFPVKDRPAGFRPASFALLNLAGPAARIIPVGGDTLTLLNDQTYASLFQVKVADAFGNLLSGVTVTFTAPATGPSVSFLVAGVPERRAHVQTNATGAALAPEIIVGDLVTGKCVLTISVSPDVSAEFSLLIRRNPS